MKRKYLSKYIFSLLLFGTNGIVASFIALPSTQIVFLRTLIGSIFLAAVFFARKGKISFYKNRAQSAYLCISGIALGVSWIFLYEAYELIGVSIASLLYYCGPVIVMVLSPVLFKESLTSATIAGFGAVLLGIFLINGGASEALKLSGIIFALMSAVMYSVMVIFNKKAKDIVGPENSLVQTTASFLTVFVFSLFRHRLEISIPTSSIIPVLILGIINTGIGCYLYFSAIGQLPAHTVSICGYLEPLSAIVFSAAVLGEEMSHVQVLGALLILGGAASSELIPMLKDSLRKKTHVK